MRKRILSAVICIVFIFSFLNFSFAANTIVEDTIIKVFINGVQAKLVDAPITVNKEILLSSTELLTKLGLKNNGRQIAFDSKKKTVTITDSNNKIILYIGNNKATINKKSIKINTAPVVYKNKNYIPVKSIVQALGKKYAWDEKTKSIYIRDTAEYNRVKSVIDKAFSTSKAVSKYMAEYTFESKSYYANKDPYSLRAKYSSKVDTKKMIMNISSEYNFGLGDTKEEAYLANNVRYSKDLGTQKWEKNTLSKKNYEEWILQYEISKIVISDILYNGLVMEDNKKVDFIKLKGNVYLQNKGRKNNQPEKDFVDTYTEITIDKKTNLISKIIFMFNRYEESSYLGKYLFSWSETYSYSNHNGSFEVVIPDESTMKFKDETKVNKPILEQITLSTDEESMIKDLVDRTDKVAVDGAYSNPYKLDATQAILFIIFKTQDDINTYKTLSDDAKKVLMNDIVQGDYGKYIGCSSVYAMVIYDSKLYAVMGTGYETPAEELELEKYDEGKPTTIVVQDKKNNTYTNYIQN